MSVEQHLETDLTCMGDDLVHDLHRGQPFQVRVHLVEGDAIRGDAGVEHLVAVRQADGVVAKALDLLEHLFVVARPEPVNHVVAGLESEPIDARHSHRVAVRVQDLPPPGVPVSISQGGRRARRREDQGESDHGDGDARKPSLHLAPSFPEESR